MRNSDPRSDTFIAAGRRVVAKEAAALGRLADSIGGSFADAVTLLSDNNGRVIVSGIGKSGHIARKIAATLASTGKPAHFVHPAEASHGDLGMVAQNDVALIISNSGETAELADIIAFTRRFGISLIGIASNAKSTLIRQAEVGIVLPEFEEACGTGIVPTTSTILALAVGDALAIALMENHSFTPEHFRRFHPGGRLGARLSMVRDLMHCGEAVPLVGDATRMPEALIVMTQKGFGVAGICDSERRLVGIITDGDLRRHMDGLLDNSVSDVMTRNPLTIGPAILAEAAVALMNDRRITCLFVVDPEGDGRTEGILHIHDCLRAGLA